MGKTVFILARLAFAALAFLTVIDSSYAAYPDKTIRLIVGFPPGGGGDTYGRVIAQALGKTMGQSVFVDNRPGAGGDIAAGVVAKSAPDGYTLLLAMSGNFSTASAFRRDLSYKVPGDFTPIAILVETPFGLMVGNTSRYKTLKQFISAAKPGKLSYASTGTGGAAQVTMELVKQKAGLSILSVPYKGSGPAITDLLGGRVDCFFAPYTPLIGQIKAGSLRLLATTAAERVPALPDVPTFKEMGLDVTMTQWYGLAAPAGTPNNIVDVLIKNVRLALKSPEVRRAYTADGAQESHLEEAAFTHFIVQDIARYRQAVAVQSSGTH